MRHDDGDESVDISLHPVRSLAAPSLETALAHVPFLRQLTADQITDVARAGATTAMGAGQMVFHAGEEGDRVYVILSGSVRVVRHDEDHEVVLTSLGPGAFFGEIALIDGGPRTASVVTIEPCELFSLERMAFFSLLAQSPTMLAGVFTNLTAMIRQNMERFLQEEVAARTLRAELELDRHRAISQMVAGVAHEINTPLGTANTAASLVKRELTPEAIPRWPETNRPRPRLRMSWKPSS
jgi:CRP-like cAMP-binding protein